MQSVLHSADASRRRERPSDVRGTVPSLPRSNGSVAKRADVLVARRRLGFGGEGRREHFVVLQADLLQGLETLVVAPLDDEGPIYEGDPLAVHVPGREAGTRSPQVLLAHLLTSALTDRFEARVAGRLSARTMGRVDDALRLVLQL